MLTDVQLVEHDSQQVHTVALDALDRAICGVLGCQRFSSRESSRAATVIEKKGLGRSGSGSTTNGATVLCSSDEQGVDDEAFECALITPLSTLYYYGRTTDIRSGALKILLHVLEVRSCTYMVILLHLLQRYQLDWNDKMGDGIGT
jgi:hypothetical protein